MSFVIFGWGGIFLAFLVGVVVGFTLVNWLADMYDDRWGGRS